MRVAIYNEKGGAGKTTLAVHLALGLPGSLVDLDEQKTATLWLGQRNPPVQTYASIEEAPTTGDVVIDFAPGKDLAKARLLASVDLVLIPVRPTFADLATVSNAVRLVAAAEKPAAFVVTMLNLRSSEAKEIGEALQPYQLPIYGVMSQRVSYGRAGVGGGTAGDTGDAAAQSELDWIIKKVRNG
jgi:chromosome partitioning protein